ncbi:hypothetical protein SUGI_0011550 [Cryptomeria japonica]|nr:hypothetical protein SUGI_0011550 [Cryptomeria japonica]
MTTSDNQQEGSRAMNEDEEDLIIRLHRLVGERWELIAGRIPGRTPEEIEKYWKSTRECSKSGKAKPGQRSSK